MPKVSSCCGAVLGSYQSGTYTFCSKCRKSCDIPNGIMDGPVSGPALNLNEAMPLCVEKAKRYVGRFEAVAYELGARDQNTADKAITAKLLAEFRPVSL